MAEIILIRHFPTPGNLEKRYIGSTDEQISKEWVTGIDFSRYPAADAVFASPLKRCLETAGLIYQDMNPVIYRDLRECSFGDFENRNYSELSENPDYQSWIDSGGTLPFPNGEAPGEFRDRCVRAFEEAVREGAGAGHEKLAFVIHGGTIMSILDRLSTPHEEYYRWQTANGKGFTAMMNEEGRLTDICSIL